MAEPRPEGRHPHTDPMWHRLLYETTCALAESATLDEAAPRMLPVVCAALDWEYGALWEVDQAQSVLRCVGTWQPVGARFEAFAAASRQATFASGIGLPGRVWASRRSAWIVNVLEDSNFPRAPIAERVGLHAALALPILTSGTLLGVMEFFSREIRQPDEALLATLTTIG